MEKEKVVIPSDEVKGSLTFAKEAHTPILTLQADGKIFVKGKEVADDIEVVEALREFMEHTGFLSSIPYSVSVDRIRAIVGMLDKLDNTPFQDIVWVKDGKVLDIPVEVADDFKKSSKTNTQFALGDY